MRTRTLILAIALTACGIAPAAAEQLVVSLSNHRIAITSSFVGDDLVLFGTIEPDAGKVTRTGYDLVVTVAGPRQTLRTRRKERVAGIWVNIDSREFMRVPSYLAILTNRPVETIATTETRRRLQIGMDNFLLTQRVGADFADTVPDDPFRAAFIRLETQYGLYRQSSTAVTFLTPTVFRAAIPIPSNVPTKILSHRTRRCDQQSPSEERSPIDYSQSQRWTSSEAGQRGSHRHRRLISWQSSH